MNHMSWRAHSLSYEQPVSPDQHAHNGMHVHVRVRVGTHRHAIGRSNARRKAQEGGAPQPQVASGDEVNRISS
jgi:hypothetical protein